MEFKLYPPSRLRGRHPLLTAVASLRFFGTFTLGNAPTLAPGAPVMILFELFGLKSFPVGVALQAAVGFFAIYLALRSRAFRFVPVAALAALPVVRAWYLQWLVPVAALSDDGALQGPRLPRSSWRRWPNSQSSRSRRTAHLDRCCVSSVARPDQRICLHQKLASFIKYAKKYGALAIVH